MYLYTQYISLYYTQYIRLAGSRKNECVADQAAAAQVYHTAVLDFQNAARQTPGKEQETSNANEQQYMQAAPSGQKHLIQGRMTEIEAHRTACA